MAIESRAKDDGKKTLSESLIILKIGELKWFSVKNGFRH